MQKTVYICAAVIKDLKDCW